MKNTINFLRVLNLIASLGVTAYVAYSYMKQCGDIEKINEKIKELVCNANHNNDNSSCDCCECEHAEEPQAEENYSTPSGNTEESF